MSHLGKTIHCKMGDITTNEKFCVLQGGGEKNLRTGRNYSQFYVIVIKNNCDLVLG